ncbi:hypothetical protein [Rubrivirga sp. IMCC45206]|uniref:hypothetical protein n=1 Tax=Rubrivirga sp. IMCC45206 TaxID=3391614 RepID=UPI00398FCCE8
MAKKSPTPDFNISVVDKKEAADILRTSRQRGGRNSKYSPIYDEVGGLKAGEFVVLRSIDKTAKLGLYQGIKRMFGEDVKMASARDRDASGEAYTLVIGRSTDHDEMRELARKG